jgi:hypothetical protein
MNIIATTAYLEPVVAQAWMQVWTLTVPPSKQHSTLTCTDGDGEHLWTEDIDLTDFPLPSVTIWVVDQIMMLPQEY